MKNYFKGIPQIIWYIGISNFLINISSVMSFTYLPLYLTHVLGVSMASLGVIEGIIDSTDLFTRVFSGFISDKMKKRKIFVSLGFLFSTLSRFLLAFSSSLLGVMGARIIDRLSHGVQASPRDALIGENAPLGMTARCYSLRYIFTVMGSVVGALLSILLMVYVTKSYQDIFLLSVVPAIIGFSIFCVFVKEKEKEETESSKVNIRDIKHLKSKYWILIISNFFLMTSMFGISFLIKGMEEKGFSKELLPLVMIVQNVIVAVSSLLFGYLADRFNKITFIKIGIGTLILSHFILSLSNSYLITFIGIALTGLQWGILYSSLSACVSEFSSPNLKGTAFGIFHFVSGIGVLIGNMLLGYLWNGYGDSTAFLVTSIGAFLSLIFISKINPSLNLMRDGKEI